MKIWSECDACGDFMCNLHDQHVFDCSCPVLEVWIDGGRDPYLDDVSDEAREFVRLNPLEDL